MHWIQLTSLHPHAYDINCIWFTQYYTDETNCFMFTIFVFFFLLSFSDIAAKYWRMQGLLPRRFDQSRLGINGWIEEIIPDPLNVESLECTRATIALGAVYHITNVATDVAWRKLIPSFVFTNNIATAHRTAAHTNIFCSDSSPNDHLCFPIFKFFFYNFQNKFSIQLLISFIDFYIFQNAQSFYSAFHIEINAHMS